MRTSVKEEIASTLDTRAYPASRCAIAKSATTSSEASISAHDARRPSAPCRRHALANADLRRASLVPRAEERNRSVSFAEIQSSSSSRAGQRRSGSGSLALFRRDREPRARAWPPITSRAFFSSPWTAYETASACGAGAGARAASAWRRRGGCAPRSSTSRPGEGARAGGHRALSPGPAAPDS